MGCVQWRERSSLSLSSNASVVRFRWRPNKKFISKLLSEAPTLQHSYMNLVFETTTVYSAFAEILVSIHDRPLFSTQSV